MQRCPADGIAKAWSGYLGEAARGHIILNGGQRRVERSSQEANLNNIDSQVATVVNALGSVPEADDFGHRVVFHIGGSLVERQCSKRTTQDQQRKYMHMLTYSYKKHFG